jgi:hypothetical protein
LENEEAIQQGEISVLMQDACHFLWGDCCGMVGGKRNQAIAVPISNARERQTYYGAVNLLTKAMHLQDYKKGDSDHPIAYVKDLQEIDAEKTLWLLWDNASYHRSTALRAFLAQENQGSVVENDTKRLRPLIEVMIHRDIP